MSSKKIILKYFNKKKDSNINNLNNVKYENDINDLNVKDVLQEYFKENFDNIKKVDFINILLLTKYLYKIKKINYFLKNKKYEDIKKIKFFFIFKKLIGIHITNNLFSWNKDEIHKRYDDFFQLQTKIITKKIFSLINYQYIFQLYFDNYINILVINKTHYIHSEIYDMSEKYIENKEITNFIRNYLNDYEICKLPSKQIIKKNELSDTDKEILNILKNITQNLIKKTLKLSKTDNDNKNLIKKTLKLSKTDNDNKNLIIYGSYTSYLINYNVVYNDIDLYHNNSLIFLTLIMMILYFILDVDIDIFKIPYILGHLSLRYKENHFLDCIYLDDYTINSIPHIYVKNIKIIDPIVQMFNNFRMLSELPRLSNVTENKDLNIIKYSSLLNESNKTLNIDYTKLYNIKHPLNFEFDNNYFIIINLNASFQDFEDYTSIKHAKKFDYLIIIFAEPNILFNMLSERNDIRISKQYFGLFNEICIEIENKNKSKLYKKNNINNVLNKEKINIQESDVNILSKKIMHEFPIEINEIFKKNNVLLMTNISTNIYIKNYITKEKCCEKTVISNISKETILSSFVLYNLLKNDNEDLKKFYIKYFLSFLKVNKKYDEFKLFNAIDNNAPQKIIKQKKIKITGNHDTFSIKNMSFKNIFFFNIQDKDYYDYDEFINLTNYNENIKKTK